MGMPFAIGASIMNVKGQHDALSAQSRANAQTATNYITSMNYSLQNLERQRRDAFEAAITDIQKIKLQGNRQASGVEAAVNEGLSGGRTANLINRAAQADINRAIASSQDNYARKSNEIDLNKEMTLMNTQRQVGSIQRLNKPTMLSTLFQLGTSYFSAKQTQEAIKAIRGQAGLGFSRKVSPATVATQESTIIPEVIQSNSMSIYKAPFNLGNFESEYSFINPFK